MSSSSPQRGSTPQRITTIAKVTLNPLQAGYRSSNSLNNNLDLIEAAIEKTLSRDGTGPNQMEAALDMNGQRVVNLPAAVDANDAVRKVDFDTYEDAAAAALAAAITAQEDVDAAVIATAADAATALASKNAAEIAEAAAQAWAAVTASATGILKYPTVAAVVADAVMSYDAGSGLVQVADGTVIDGGGFRYQVVTTGEHLTTAGGVKLRALKGAGRYFASAFGFVAGLSLADANAKLQIAFNALASGDTLELDFEGTIDVSDATLATNGVALVLPEGAHLRQANSAINAHAIKITGDDVRLEGPGKISAHIAGLADYSTTGSGITRSIIHWTGDRPYIDGLEIATPSRCGIFLDACASPTTLNCRGDGGYLLADYNPASTLNLYAFYYSPSGQDADAGNVWKNGGHKFSNYISPEASGALSGAGTYAPDMNNSYHETCWDHGYYLLSTKGGKIRGHRSLNTRLPLAATLDGTIYENPQHTWTVTSGLNAEAGISVRGIRNGGALRNVVLEGGLGGYIDFRPPTAYGDIEPVVEGFRARPTGVSATLVESIRCDNFVLGATPTDDVLRPRLTGLDIVNKSTGAAPVVRVRGASGFVISDAVVSGKVQHTGSTSAVSFDYCDDADLEDFTFDRSGYDAGSAATLDSVLLSNCNRLRIARPRAVYTSGGVNVTARGINIAATCADTIITGFKNDMTSGSLVSVNPILDSGTRTQRSANRYSTSALLSGKVTFPTASGSVIVTNANIRSGSRILISPASSGAAKQASNTTHEGVYVSEEAASGRFRLLTGTGAATSIAGDWFWHLDG